MAVGWAKDGAAQEEIESTIEEALDRVRRETPHGASRESCDACGRTIPTARREAVPGVRLCVSCQSARDGE
jgi:phage/conjugal plasmid C-4 type zinc finger TraR family protein